MIGEVAHPWQSELMAALFATGGVGGVPGGGGGGGGGCVAAAAFFAATSARIFSAAALSAMSFSSFDLASNACLSERANTQRCQTRGTTNDEAGH